MISLAGFTRRRRALVTAVLPYLLLSVFVDFVHLHRLIAGPVALSATSAHVKDAGPGGSNIPATSCAICQWQRAGTGMQTSVTAEAMPGLIPATVEDLPSSVPHRPDLGSPDFRGPPVSPSL